MTAPAAPRLSSLWARVSRRHRATGVVPSAERDTAPLRALGGSAEALEGGSAAGQAAWRLPPRATQPGIAADAATVGDLEVRAASVIGSGHRCVEPAVTRQDAYALALDDSGSHLVVAVADGVSSCRHSDLGARVAVSTATREVVAALNDGVAAEDIDAAAVFAATAGEIAGSGRERGFADADLCCVAVVAVVPARSLPDGRRRAWTAQLGDVSVWVRGTRLEQRTGTRKSGLDANVVEDVLPFRPGAVTTSVIDLDAGAALAVVTDGVGDLLTDVATAAPYFVRAWARPAPPARFLGDLTIDAPGQDDDRTAVVVWCGPGARS